MARGFTLVEILIVVAVVGIIAAVAVPGLLRARSSANETAALTALRAVNSAETSYRHVCGHGGYAVLFPTLAVGPGNSGTGFLSPDLTASTEPLKSRYRFTLQAGSGGESGPQDCNGTATNTQYYATAVPESPGVSGVRAFATNQEQGIWQDSTGAAPAEPFVASGTVSPLQ